MSMPCTAASNFSRTHTSARPARHRVVRALVATVCITATQAGCGDDGTSGAHIALVPYTEAPAGTWEWTPACRVGPRTSTGCDAAGPVRGVAQLAGNAWNLGGRATSGSLRMSMSATGTLQVKGDLSSAPPCTDSTCVAPEANTWVRGFPSVLYGIDQCNAATSPPQASELRLPMRVGSIPSSLIGTTVYDAKASQVTYTVAYDMWLNASATRTPCRTDGTVEVMVWTDYDAQALLPDSMKVGTATIPFAVNGARNEGNNSWWIFASNVYERGRTEPWGGTVWLVLNDAHIASKGSVSVDLSAALAAVGKLLENNYGWTDFAKTYWLDTIAFGIEYGPADGNLYGAGPIDFTMDLTSYCLAVGTKIEKAGC